MTNTPEANLRCFRFALIPRALLMRKAHLHLGGLARQAYLAIFQAWP